jgi:hypothetical protein
MDTPTDDIICARHLTAAVELTELAHDHHPLTPPLSLSRARTLSLYPLLHVHDASTGFIVF